MIQRRKRKSSSQHFLASKSDAPLWREVLRQLKSASHIALLLDFDGTLVRLRQRPGQVWLPERARKILVRHARRSNETLAIISGRSLPDLRRRVRIPGAILMGLHGWEIAGQEPRRAKQIARRVTEFRKVAGASFRGIAGIHIEDKRYGLSIHYRSAPPASIRRAGKDLRSIFRAYRSEFRIQPGKKIWEVLPRDARGKGAAAKELLRRLPRNAAVFYIGDDTGDESAFKALRRAITICVGPAEKTNARFRLHSPEHVLSFLSKLPSAK